MAINKVIYGGVTLIDLTGDDAVESDVASGKKFHKRDGSQATGTASGGGGKNVQGYLGQDYSRQNTLVATDVALKVAKSGTYKVSWSGFRNTTSGTSQSQLYINDNAYGSAQGTFNSSYGQNVVLSNVSLSAGDELVVYARARSSSYYMYVSNLIIEEQ